MLALPISMPRFKRITFYQNSLNIKLFLQKNAKLSSAGGSPQTPAPAAAGGFASRFPASGGWRLRSLPDLQWSPADGPKTPKFVN